MKSWRGLLLAAGLLSGCVTYDRLGSPVPLDSHTLSIQTVRYGATPTAVHAAETDLHLHDRRPAQVSPDRKVEDTLYVERGDFHIENTDAQVFRLEAKKNTVAEYLHLHTKKTATQITVHFGAIQGNMIEVKSGLHEGDQVIVSDMRRYMGLNQISIE